MLDATALGLASNTAFTFPLAGFLLGVASGVHCIGMCGGIVGAFSAQGVIKGPGERKQIRAPSLALLASFNAGRVATYTLAGAVAGTLGSVGVFAAHLIDIQKFLFLLANLALVLIGLHLAGISPLLARFEVVGLPVWRRIQPLAAKFMPAATPLRALLAGSLWGWLPCGLVYAMLATAVAAGSPGAGALTMLAFGLGTVPNLLLAGVALVRLRQFAAHRAVRLVAGGAVLAFGVVGLARAADLEEAVRRGLLCL